jgi:hypothetical protein
VAGTIRTDGATVAATLLCSRRSADNGRRCPPEPRGIVEPGKARYRRFGVIRDAEAADHRHDECHRGKRES